MEEVNQARFTSSCSSCFVHDGINKTSSADQADGASKGGKEVKSCCYFHFTRIVFARFHNTLKTDTENDTSKVHIQSRKHRVLRSLFTCNMNNDLKN